MLKTVTAMKKRSRPLPLRTRLTLHSELIGESIGSIVQTASAHGTAAIGIVFAHFTYLKKLDHLFVRARLHTSANVFRDGFSVVLDLFQ